MLTIPSTEFNHLAEGQREMFVKRRKNRLSSLMAAVEKVALCSTLFVAWTATNGNGESDLVDQKCIPWTANGRRLIFHDNAHVVQTEVCRAGCTPPPVSSSRPYWGSKMAPLQRSFLQQTDSEKGGNRSHGRRMPANGHNGAKCDVWIGNAARTWLRIRVW